MTTQEIDDSVCALLKRVCEIWGFRSIQASKHRDGSCFWYATSDDGKNVSGLHFSLASVIDKVDAMRNEEEFSRMVDSRQHAAQLDAIRELGW